MNLVLIIIAFCWLQVGASARVQRELFGIRRFLGMGVLDKYLGVPEIDFEARATALTGVNFAMCSALAIYMQWPNVQTIGVIIIVCPIFGALLTRELNRRRKARDNAAEREPKGA